MSSSSSISLVPAPSFSPHPYKVGESIEKFPVFHLVYVHGFRGDHTSFQRFPTDLHYTLDERIPSLHTHVYPTYKSRKPLQFAVDRLMDWMETLAVGSFILIGHSLGGFVVAEAAMQFAQRNSCSAVIGFIAMDAPYLGLHPHVVISGLASVIPSFEHEETEEALNDDLKVDIVERPTGDDESSMASSSASSSLRESSRSTMLLPDLSPGPTRLQNTLHFFRKHSTCPFSAIKDWLVSSWEHAAVLIDREGLETHYHRIESWSGGEWVNFYTETVPEAYELRRSRSPTPTLSSSSSTTSLSPGSLPKASRSTFTCSLDDLPLLPLRKSKSPNPSHSIPTIHIGEPALFTPFPDYATEEQLSLLCPPRSPSVPSDASSERACMRPKSIRETRIEPSMQSALDLTLKIESTHRADRRQSDRPSGVSGTLLGSPRRPRSPGPPRHFIVLPSDSVSSRNRWERAAVAGVPSEVVAHCSVFYRSKNWDYDSFVRRVAGWIVKTCQARMPDVVC